MEADVPRPAAWPGEGVGEPADFEVALEDEPCWGTFPPTSLAIGLAGVLGCATVLAGKRIAGSLLALASVAGVLDEAENGPRIVRRALRRQQTTVNVVARAGDPDGARTLVLLAHHDAAQTGRLFDQSLQISQQSCISLFRKNESSRSFRR